MLIYLRCVSQLGLRLFWIWHHPLTSIIWFSFLIIFFTIFVVYWRWRWDNWHWWHYHYKWRSSSMDDVKGSNEDSSSNVARGENSSSFGSYNASDHWRMRARRGIIFWPCHLTHENCDIKYLEHSPHKAKWIIALRIGAPTCGRWF